MSQRKDERGSVTKKAEVLIVGGGFGGVYTARTLLKKGFNVTLVNKTNFFIFTPLLHEVATGSLNANDITDEYSSIYGEVVENQGDYMVINSGGIIIERNGDTWTAGGVEMQLTDERRSALEAFANEAEAGDTLNVITGPNGNIYLRDDDGTWQQYDYNRHGT